MESTNLRSGNFKSLLSGKEYSIEINLGKLFILLTLIYAVLFTGGIEPFYLRNTIKLHLLSLFSIVSPSVICFYLYQLFSEKYLRLTISPSLAIRFLITVILISAYAFLNYYNKFNLQGDEVAYAHISLSISRIIYDLITPKFASFLSQVPVSYLLQGISFILWMLIFSAFYFITSTKAKTKLRLALVLFLVFVFRMLGRYIIGISFTHPPLIYLFSSLASTIGGLNDKSFAISIFFSYIMFFAYLLYRIRVSYIIYICIVLSILSIPVIGYWSFMYEQAIFSFFCFSIVIIEISRDEIEPVYLVCFVSIAVLFRQSCIVAFLPLIPYGIHYLKKYKIPFFSAQTWVQLAPAFFMLPTFLFAILKGTPTTPALLKGYDAAHLSIIDKLLNLDLIVACYTVLKNYVFLMIMGLVLLIYQRKYLILLSIVLIWWGYVSLLLIGVMPKFEAKYFLELYGFILVISIVNWFVFIHRRLKLNGIAIGLSLIFMIYKDTLAQKQVGYMVWPKNQYSIWKEHENHFVYINEFIRKNNIYDKSIVLGIDYGTLPYILNNVNVADLSAIEQNRRKYLESKGGGWLDIDLDALKNNASIDYAFINDYLDSCSSNRYRIDSLILIYHWQPVMKIPITGNTTGCIGLKRHK